MHFRKAGTEITPAFSYFVQKTALNFVKKRTWFFKSAKESTGQNDGKGVKNEYRIVQKPKNQPKRFFEKIRIRLKKEKCSKIGAIKAPRL